MRELKTEIKGGVEIDSRKEYEIEIDRDRETERHTYR